MAAPLNPAEAGTRPFPDKPVGTVWFAIAERQGRVRATATLRAFRGDREAIRRQSVAFALRLILQHALS